MSRQGARVRAWLRAAAIVASLGVLAGCAQLPHTGVIKEGPILQSGLNSDYLYYSPSGPVVGQTQREVVSGFITAATGPQNDYAIARQYLSTSLRSKWSPNDEVLIQQGDLKITLGENNTAIIDVGVQASIDAEGLYQAKPPGTRRSFTIGLVKTGGQWRIASAPNLTVVIRPVFDVIFRSYPLYFFDHTFTKLVPDVRWFPARASTATRLVTSLLKGPNDWMADAVESPMPKGTKLAIDAVTVEAGVAQVNLNPRALEATPNARQYFKAQLTATLGKLPGVNSVQVLIDRSPQDIPDYAESALAPSSTNPVAIADGRLVTVGATTFEPIAGTRNYLTTLGANDFALSADKRSLALKSKSGTYLMLLGQVAQQPTLVDSRPKQLSPRYDHRGWLWTATATGSDAFRATGYLGDSAEVLAPWIGNFQIHQFSISPEGSRIAYIASIDGTRRTYLAGIVRNRQGQPIALTKPVQLPAAHPWPVSIAWCSPLNLLQLYRNPGDSEAIPVVLTIGGASLELDSVTGATQIMANTSGSSYFALTQFGEVLQYRGYNWTPFAGGVTIAHMAN
jgi:hypothetical protein